MCGLGENSCLSVTATDCEKFSVNNDYVTDFEALGFFLQKYPYITLSHANLSFQMSICKMHLGQASKNTETLLKCVLFFGCS